MTGQGRAPHKLLYPGTPPPAPASFSFPSAAAVLARPSGRPITVTVEGNIGAGKSTLLNYFHHYPSIRVHKEPLAVWQNLSGTNLLELAYRDQARWGMTFESLVSLTMTEIHTADCRRPGQADWAPLKAAACRVSSLFRLSPHTICLEKRFTEL